MKSVKRLFASFLVVLTVLTSVPLQGFTDLDWTLPDFGEWFGVQAEAEEVVNGIPEDAFFYDGNFYKVYSGVCNTWEEAKDYCVNLGGHLAVISNDNENQALYSYVKSLGYRSVYFGYTDRVTEGVWKWVTGEDFNYTNWHKGEPNSQSSYEDYAMFYSGFNDSSWNDGDFERHSSLSSKRFICEWDAEIEIPPEKYTVKVVDSKGKPVQSADVYTSDASGVIDETTIYSTDSKGLAIINKFSIGTLNYEVRKTDYITYTTVGKNYEFSDSGYDIVRLYKEDEADLMLESVYYRDTNASFSPTATSKNVDILTKTKRLSMTNSSILAGTVETGHFKLTCKPVNSSKIKLYQLWQGSKQIAQSTNGVFNLAIKNFSQGKGVFVRIFSSDKSMDTPINLEICKDEKIKNAKLSFGDKMKFSVPDSVPFVGGTELSFDIPNLLIEFSIEDGKVMAGVNVKLDPDDKNKSLKEQYNEIKQSIEDVKKLSNYKIGSHTKEKINKFLKSKNELNLPAVGDVSVMFFGVGECEWSDRGIDKITINLCLIVDASVKKNWQTMVSIVPVTINIKGGVEGKLSANGSYEFDAQTLNGDIELNLKPYLEAFGGVGVSDYIGVGAYGNADVDIGIQLVGTTTEHGLKTVDLTGELGLKAYAGPLEYSKPFAYNTWHLYTRTKSRKASSYTANSYASDMYDIDEYTLQDTSYLENESAWVGDIVSYKSRAKSAVQENEIKTLISGTYRNSQPVMASNGTNAVLAYMGADTSRGAYNLTKIMTSVYDSATQTWSEPVQVDTNKTADSAPYLYSDGKDIWLAYQEASKVFSKEPTVEDYIASQRIVVAKFDKSAKKFVVQKTFDNTGSYYRMPKIVSVGNKLTVAWLSSEKSDMFGQGTDNDIITATLSNGTWSKAAAFVNDKSTITEFAVGDIDGQLKVAYISDEDADLETSEDIVVFVASKGSVVKYSDASATNMQFAVLPDSEAAEFVWTSGTNLVSTKTGKEVTTHVNFGSNPESVQILSDRVLVTMEDEGKSQIFSVSYDDTAKTWTAPAKVTLQDKYIERMTAAETAGKIIATMTRKAVTITEDDVIDDCELSWCVVNDREEVTVELVSYEQENVKAGENLPLTVSVKNSGSVNTKNFVITVKNPEGKTVATYTPTEEILSGAEAELTVNVPMNETVTLEDYTVTVSSTMGKFAESTFTTKIGYPDFAADIEILKHGVMNSAVITVKNEGASAAEGKLELSGIIESEQLKKEFDIPTLQPGQTKTFVIDTTSDLGENVLVATATVTGDEYYISNNTAKSYIENTKYTAEFKVDGEVYNTADYDIGDEIVLPEPPTKEGYVFKGWTPEVPETMPAVDKTFEAVFEDENAINLTKPSELTAIQTTDSIKLTWSAVSGATGYRIYKNVDSKWKALGDIKGTTVTIKNLTIDTKYTFAVRAYNITGGKTTWAEDYATITASTSSLGKPSKITPTQSTTAVKLTWNKVSGATGYRVYQNVDGKWVNKGTTKNLSGTVKNLKAGTKYSFAVKAYNITNGKTTWASSYTTISTATQAVKPSKITTAQNATAIKLTWTKCSGATGYRVYYRTSTKNSWSTLVKAMSGTSYTAKNLPSGKSYQFAVKPYISTSSGVVWSDYTTVITSTLPANPVAKVSSTKGKVTLKWSAVSGAQGYQVYYKSGNGSWKLYKTYTKPTTLNFNLKSGAKYTFAVRAYRTVSGQTFRSSYKAVSVTVK